MSKIYKEHLIWKRIDREETAIRFNCFEILGENKFCVQGVDYFSLPVDDAQIRGFNNQYIELFIEDSPENRSDLYDTLEDAIIFYERKFID